MSETGGTGTGRPPRERAEEVVDHLGVYLGALTAHVGQRLLRLAALAREEVEDIVAEAQHIRGRGQR